MSKYLISLALLAILAAPSMSQEENTVGEPAAEPQDVNDELSAPDSTSEDLITGDEDLDEQTYEEDEDDFVPTEEIPADEPIPFPSNI